MLPTPDISLVSDRDAEKTLIQILGAQNLSNPYYKVHPRRNDRFLQAHAPLLKLFPEIDFTEYHFNKHLLSALRSCDIDRYEILREALQDCWVERMGELIGEVGTDVLLLWIKYDLDQHVLFGQEPALVDRPMVDALRSSVAGVVELPVHTAQDAADVDGMFFGQLDLPSAQRMIGPQEHHRIAEHLRSRLS
ncbi:DUF6473 family protein [Phaeobacter sp.]|uniref:DUF6473 family protein n=1 Tax=Phaeobacter sp. TaxID=1902409 RepID=UPI0025DA65E2|nr:DUF6473 family protein [Phaeobacter sp.]